MKPSIMGILNVTPDSFSDGGKFLNSADAIAHAELLASQGAEIIDIGGESTRPGSNAVVTELARISEVVANIAGRYFVSVDTFRPETAEACLKLGAKMINDVSALRFSPTMADIIAAYNSEIVLMYSKQADNSPHATREIKDYDNVISEIMDFLSARVEFALSRGIKQSKIILDPGMGSFVSPDPKYSWELLARLDELCKHFRDFRILVGTSRKGFLANPKKNLDPQNLDALSQLTALSAATKGANIIRTHNVEMASEFCKTWAALNQQ